MNVRERMCANDQREIIYIYRSKCISIEFVYARVLYLNLALEEVFFHLLYDHLNLILLTSIIFLLLRETNFLSHYNCLFVYHSKVIHTIGKIRLHKYERTETDLLYILYTTVMFPFFFNSLETKISLIIRDDEHS